MGAELIPSRPFGRRSEAQLRGRRQTGPQTCRLRGLALPPFRVALAPATGCPGFHSNICTSSPEAPPRVRGHLCDNGSFPRYGGSGGPLPPHCAAARRVLLGRERAVAGPGASGRGSHPEEDRAWPACPVSSDSIRQTHNPISARSPRGPTPGSGSEPQSGRPRLAGNSDTPLRKAGALPPPLRPARPDTLSASQTAASGPAPSALTVAPERRNYLDRRGYGMCRELASLKMTALKLERTKY